MILGVGKHLERRLCTGTLSAGILLLLIALPFPAEAASGISGFIYGLCVGIGGFVAWVFGALLDQSIGWLLIGMGEQIRTGGIGIAINALWAIIRDIFNILFIFGLVYIGFKTMLSAGDTSTRKQLAMLIAAALLINFSLFISQAVVDFTNIAATQIYNLISVEETTSSNSILGYKNISAAFMHFAQLQTYAEPNAEALQKIAEDSDGFRVVAMGFMMMIFLLITGFVFAAGAVLIVIRFVILVLFMIASPIMFLGWVIPGLSKYSKMWLESFIKYAIMGPAYMFMLYLSLRVLKEMQMNGSFVEALSDPSTTSGSFQIVVYFIVIIAFVVASLLVSKQLGVVGASQSINMLNGGQKRIRQGVQGFAGRKTVGALSSGIQKGYRRLDARDGRMARGMRALGLDRSVENLTEKGKKAKFGGSSSYEDVEKFKKESKKRRAHTRGALEIEDAILKTDYQNPEDRRAAIQRAVQGKSIKQLEEAGDDVVGNREVLRAMNKSQWDSVMKSDEFDDQEKAQFKKDRSDAVEAMLREQAGNNAQLVEAIGEAGIEQLEALGIEKLKQNAKGLNFSQIDDLKKSKAFIESDIKEVTTTHKDAATSSARSNPAQFFSKNKAADVAKLPIDVFTDPNTGPYLTPEMIEEKMKKGISKTELDDIRNNIDSAIAADKNANPATTTGQPNGGAYTKQWANWVNRSPMGARLGLVHV